MEPQIQALLDEVPADFQPTFEPKPEDERILGTLDSLDADTRRIINGVFYFASVAQAALDQVAPQVTALIAEGDALNAAHKAEHQNPAYVDDGVGCQKTHDALHAIEVKIGELQASSGPAAEKMGVLQKASGPALFQHFDVRPGERVAFRTEGVTAAPPEPMAGLPPEIAALLGQLGGNVSVIGIGPEGITDLSGGPRPAPRKRSLRERLLGRGQ